MSSPKAPYYYKKGTDTYHWETKCSKNHYPDADWVKTDEKPASKEQCNECKGEIIFIDAWQLSNGRQLPFFVLQCLKKA